jgi:hypothetical protein
VFSLKKRGVRSVSEDPKEIVKCPLRLDWLKAMAEVLPEDCYGKLRPYIEHCLPKKE